MSSREENQSSSYYHDYVASAFKHGNYFTVRRDYCLVMSTREAVFLCDLLNRAAGP